MGEQRRKPGRYFQLLKAIKKRRPRGRLFYWRKICPDSKKIRKTFNIFRRGCGKVFPAAGRRGQKRRQFFCAAFTKCFNLTAAGENLAGLYLLFCFGNCGCRLSFAVYFYFLPGARGYFAMPSVPTHKPGYSHTGGYIQALSVPVFPGIKYIQVTL